MKRKTILRSIPRQERNRVIKMLKLFDLYRKPILGYKLHKSKEYIYSVVKLKIEYVVGTKMWSIITNEEIKTLRELMDTYPAVDQTKLTLRRLLSYFINGGLLRMVTLSVTKVVADKYGIDNGTPELDDMTRRQLIALSKINWYK